MKKTTVALVTAILLAYTLVDTAAAAEVTFQNHRLEIRLDVAARTAHITDEGRAVVHRGWNVFHLAATALIDSMTIDGRQVAWATLRVDELASLPPAALDDPAGIDTSGRAQLVLFEWEHDASADFTITYSAVFDEDVANTRFSHGQVAREIAGTIEPRGAYLSPSAYYYPVGSEQEVSVVLTADIPADWESISDGNRVATASAEGRKLQTWSNPYASDGCMFMAAPYVVRSRMLDSIEVACYFFPEDSALIDQYLHASIDYIRMYSDLIGPYPYERFTVAENFFPTGYGMPAWTLLGQQVIRLPFIVKTSLGHEVLHNWWGNSVYVDYDRGNWCEGLTVYGADYRYKLLSSEQEAIDYRKNVLKDYAGYVSEGKDFPLREFTARTEASSRTIGYGKSMMVFHMIHNRIGSQAFYDAWRYVYDTHRGRKVAWADWIDAFERTSAQPLALVLPQWIDQPGAPRIELGPVQTTDSGSLYRVTFELLQTADDAYDLLVPVRVIGLDTTVDTSVHLASRKREFSFAYPFMLEQLAVDPDFDLFRHLLTQEMEPVFSGVLGAERQLFVTWETGPVQKVYAAFANNMTGDTANLVPADQLGAPDPNIGLVLLNPAQVPPYLIERLRLTADSVRMMDQSYPRAGHTFILAVDDFRDFERCLVVLSNDLESLPRVGQLLPHYGKYSYLIFEGTTNVGKGQWPVGQSPLHRWIGVQRSE
jgi:aminopeptidase N